MLRVRRGHVLEDALVAVSRVAYSPIKNFEVYYKRNPYKIQQKFILRSNFWEKMQWMGVAQRESFGGCWLVT